MHYVENQFVTKKQSGFVLPLALSLILLTSLASASAIHTASTQIWLIGSEKHYLHALHLAEVQLVSTEKLLLIDINELSSPSLHTSQRVAVESFKPKHYRSKANTLSQHYKITVNSQLIPLIIQSTIRIDETIQPIKNKAPKKDRLLKRLSWEIIS